MYLLRKMVLAGLLFSAGVNMFAQESAYAYDANGNLTKDLNKNIVDIQYNSLNLPSRIVFKNGDNISHVYSADGSKLRTVWVADGDTLTTDYCGNVIYENGVPVRLMTDVGYIALSDTSYHYFIKDHQGNVRVVADEHGNAEEVNDYYAFGGLMSTSSRQSVQPYKYNGKELDRKGGLDWYDYGARMYDATLGRWHVVDPMAEKYYSISPYVYCANNPVRFIDPEGKEWKTKDDAEYAESLSQAMIAQIDIKQKKLDRLDANIAKKQTKGKDVSKDQVKAEEMRMDINNLRTGVSELIAMGETKEQIFTYNKVEGNIGGTDIKEGVITMDIAGNGAKSNGVHESSHGYDLWKNGRVTENTAITGEVKAYSRQFSFDKSSMPVSDFGQANSLGDINHRWVLGINNSGDYLYIRYVYPNKNPKDILRIIK